MKTKHAVNERNGCLSVARVYELLEEFGVSDSDLLKHRLEDWERFDRDARTSGSREHVGKVFAAALQPDGRVRVDITVMIPKGRAIRMNTVCAVEMETVPR